MVSKMLISERLLNNNRDLMYMIVCLLSQAQAIIVIVVVFQSSNTSMDAICKYPCSVLSYKSCYACTVLEACRSE